MMDILKRIKEFYGDWSEPELLHDCLQDAADEIESLRQQLAKCSLQATPEPAVEPLIEALREIADETYDSWTNGAKAGRLAKDAIAAYDALEK
jgi:hypothetical protein